MALSDFSKGFFVGAGALVALLIVGRLARLL
jgi:hypothetical protein